MRGLLITFEGPEGAGKTTQIQLLDTFLKQVDLSVILLREPGGTTLGEEIRRLLLEPTQKITPVAEVLLYAAARAQLVEKVIKPELARGSIILCDRFVDASLAYQGYGRGLGMESVLELNRLALSGMQPDLTVLLDIEPSTGLKRARATRETLDRIEQEDLSFHRRVRDGYLQIAKSQPERFLVIDALKSQVEINTIINTHVRGLLRNMGR